MTKPLMHLLCVSAVSVLFRTFVLKADELLSNDLVNIGCAFQSQKVGGAGYCIYLVCSESVQLLRQRAVGLHQCLDNIVAEVKACRYLVEEIVDVNEYASLNLTASPIVVQGDILPVIKHRCCAHWVHVWQQFFLLAGQLVHVTWSCSFIIG